MDKPCIDLVGYLVVLGRYFYTHIFVCKTHLLLLVVCYHLKTNYLKNTYDCFCTMWTNGLAHSDLLAFAKDYKDLFFFLLLLIQENSVNKISISLADVVVVINYCYLCSTFTTITLIQRITIDYKMVIVKTQ